MTTATIEFTGNLRTRSVHTRSGEVIITDAPIDNKGKGEYFSPTDMLSSALGSCIFTIMGIAAQEHGFSIDGARCSVIKIMSDSPRAVAEVKIDFDFTGKQYTDKQKKILELCVRNCPVSRSLHPDLFQNVKLIF